MTIALRNLDVHMEVDGNDAKALLYKPGADPFPS